MMRSDGPRPLRALAGILIGLGLFLFCGGWTVLAVIFQ